VYPDAWIWNYGNQVVSLPVKFHIGGWVSYVDVNNLIPGAQRLAVSPDPYVAYPGTHRVMVAALLLGDLRPEDNVREHTLQVPGLVTPGVEVVSIDAPLGRIDTFTTVPPRATIHNYGVRSETCRVWFYVENAVDSIVYCESLCMTMAAGARLTLDFPPTRFHDLGWHVSTCSVHCRPSQVEPDDVLSDSFLVLAQLTGDLGITQLLVPYDTIDTMIPQSMTVGVHNYSCTEACSGTVWIAVADTLGETVVYRESVAFLLQAGETRRLDLPTHRFTTLGRHDAELGLRAWRGPTDTLRWSFWVVLRLGVAEGPRPSALHLPPATLIRGVLYLGAGTVPGRGLSRALLLDATGRAVMALKPGPNDVRRLPAGVYFVRHSGTVPTGQGTIPIRARVLLAR
jgi:hypothetical protein